MTTSFRMTDNPPPDLDRWDRLSLTDLEHLNRYAQDKMLYHNYNVPFHALSSHWADTISPGVPDGRYVTIVGLNLQRIVPKS